MPPTQKFKDRIEHSARKSEGYGKPTFADLPRICLHKIIQNCSISSLLSLYSTCADLRSTIQSSPTIVGEVFSHTHDFTNDPLPPAMSKITAADPHLHPLFAKAIEESYDGFDFEDSDYGGVDGRYFVFLIHRCAVVHDIDVALSRARPEIVGGLRRKIALMAFGRMLDCIENWADDKKANGLGGDVSPEEYFSWCMETVGGFEHMLKTAEEREDICDAVGLFYKLGPKDLVKGWDPKRAWSYQGWRVRMFGFCLLGGLGRMSEALAGQYFLAEMRDESGLELPIARGISSWIAFEKREREKGRLRLEKGMDS